MSSSNPLSLIPADISLLLAHRTDSPSSSGSSTTPRLSLSALLPAASRSNLITSSTTPLAAFTPARAPAKAPTTPDEGLRLVRDLMSVSGEAKVAEGRVDALGDRVELVRGRLEQVQGSLEQGTKGWGMEDVQEEKGELA